MLESLRKPGRPLTEADVAEFERELGALLPSDYRSFLLEHNGGLPVPDAFPIQGFAEETEGELQVLFGVHRSPEASDLRWNLRQSEDLLQHGLLPIGCNSGGDLICLSLFGDDVGAVHFWDSRDPRGADATYRLAGSFTEFVASIRKPEET